MTSKSTSHIKFDIPHVESKMTTPEWILWSLYNDQDIQKKKCAYISGVSCVSCYKPEIHPMSYTNQCRVCMDLCVYCIKNKTHGVEYCKFPTCINNFTMHARDALRISEKAYDAIRALYHVADELCYMAKILDATFFVGFMSTISNTRYNVEEICKSLEAYCGLGRISCNIVNDTINVALMASKSISHTELIITNAALHLSNSSDDVIDVSAQSIASAKYTRSKVYDALLSIRETSNIIRDALSVSISDYEDACKIEDPK